MELHHGHAATEAGLGGRLSAAGRASAAVRARIRGALHLLRGPRQWSELVTRILWRGRVHQDNSLTRLDRYPVLFQAARTLLGDCAETKILSYGCSSGEEALTLRRYFPTAAIVGAEINPHLLRACRRLPRDPAMTFIPSTEDALRAQGPYDAIFCMAVLTRRPHEVEQRRMRDIAGFYPFDLFAREVRFLACLLRPGGVLVVEHALYRVEDAIRGAPVLPVFSHGLALAKGPRFEPAGSLIVPQPVIARIFRKEAA